MATMTDRPTPQPSSPSPDHITITPDVEGDARRITESLNDMLGRADSPSPEGAEPRTEAPWFAQGPLLHGPDNGGIDIGPLIGEMGTEADAAYVAHLVNEKWREAALPEPSLDVETIRDLFGANGWYVANVDDATWVESSEWGPTLLAELARLGTGETE